MRCFSLIMQLKLALLGLLAAVAAQEEDEEGRAVLLLHKKIFPTTDFSVGTPINVTLRVYNKGARRESPLKRGARRPWGLAASACSSEAQAPSLVPRGRPRRPWHGCGLSLLPLCLALQRPPCQRPGACSALRPGPRAF